MSASESGSVDAAHLLLTSGVATQVRNRQGLSAIHLARENGHIKIVEIILNVSEFTNGDEGFNLVESINLNEWLQWAAKNGHSGCVGQIITAGAKLEVMDKSGMTALATACVELCDISAFSGSWLQKAKMLRKRAKLEEVIKMLVSATQVANGLDAQNNAGQTVLMYAAMHGLSSIVKLLLAAGAKPEQIDTNGQTALLLACEKGHPTTTELLIMPTAAADALNVTDKGGMTALALACVKLGDMLALSESNLTLDFTVSVAEVQKAVEWQCWVKATKTNLEVGRWVKVTEAFARSSAGGSIVCLTGSFPQDLLGRVTGLGSLSRDLLGKPVWNVHANLGDYRRFEFKNMNYRHSFEAYLHETDFHKISVLSLEEFRKQRTHQEEIVKMLVSLTQAAGALDIPNNKGCTVLMYAAMRGLSSVVKHLIAAGARPSSQAKGQTTQTTPLTM